MTSSARSDNPRAPERNRPRPRSWALVGIPDQQGVMNVGGRLGAALGPSAFRKYLARLGGREAVLQSLDDRGDVTGLGSEVDANHRRAAALIASARRKSGLVVVVGGGHDHAYSHLAGLADALPGETLGCINIDAHLDVRKVRPAITSGSGFYLALEAGILEGSRLVEFGIQSHCNSDELWRYVESRRVTVVPFQDLRGGQAPGRFSDALKALGGFCDRIVISLDLDAAAMAFAPGVSAPQAEGFTSSEIIGMMEHAGAFPKVESLGIFELNPLHDSEDRTSRLAATAAHHFVDHALRDRKAAALDIQAPTVG